MSSNNDSNENDTATNQVLEYYKKYSQNRDLPKYFSGSSVAYLPTVDIIGTESQSNSSKSQNYHDERQLEENGSVIHTNIDIKITSATESEKSEDQNNDTSRSSSSMSNKRLEWDNGADIGYNNCRKQNPKPPPFKKSASLTALTELKKKNSNIDLQKLASEYTKGGSSSESNVQVIIVTYSSSSSDDDSEQNKNAVDISSSSSAVPAEVEPLITSSTSTDYPVKSSSSNSESSPKLGPADRIDQKMSNFAVTLLQLKQKIGLPNAHSTPNYFEFLPINPHSLVDTPFHKKANKIPRKLLEKSMKPTSKSDEEVSLGSEHKYLEANLPLSRSEESIVNRRTSNSSKSRSSRSYSSKKPSPPLPPRNVPKVVNLCLTKPITVECICSLVVPKTQLIQTAPKLSTVAVQTDVITESDLVQTVKQSCGLKEANQSVVYFQHREGAAKTDSSTSQTDSYLLTSCGGSFEYKKNPYDSEPLTKPADVPFQVGGLKRFQRESDLRTVEPGESDLRTVEPEFKAPQPLEQLGDAANVNSATENIGKAIHLIQRLIQSKKYNPTVKKKYIKSIIQKMSESRYFADSSTSSDLFFPRKKVDLCSGGKTSSDSSGKNSDNHNCLQSNLPWLPAHSNITKSPRKRKFEIKTFTDVIIPPPDCNSKAGNCSSPEIVPVETKPKAKNSYFTLTNNEFCVNRMTDSTNSDGPCIYDSQDGTSLRKHYKSSSTSGSGSYENWREDKTLSEKLLEAKRTTNNKDPLLKFAEQERQQQLTWINSEITHLSKLRNLLKHPCPKQDPKPDQKPVKKRTTVYQVCETESDPAKSSTDTGSSRNYVIETQLGAPPSCGTVHFQLNGRKYSVDKLDGDTRKPPCNRKVGGDIQVTTRDNVTNIKVSTFCQVCKQVPCVCCCPKCHKICCNCAKIRACCSGCDKSECTCSKDSVPTTDTTCSCGKICLRTASICRVRQIPFPECDVNPEVNEQHCTTCGCLPCVCKEIVSDSVQCSRPAVTDANVGFCTTCCKSFCTCGKTKMSADQGCTFPKMLDKNLGECSKTKYSADQCCTFPKMSNKKLGNSLPHTFPKQMCSRCQKCPCICESLKENPLTRETTAQTPVNNTCDAQEQFEGNSLKRVFENCDCTTQTNCNCHFVDKLVRHFKQNTERVLRGGKITQTHHSKGRNVGVQAEVPTQHMFSQTSKIGAVTLSAVHQETATIGLTKTFKSKGTQGLNNVKSVTTEQPQNYRLTFGDQVKSKCTQYQPNSKAVCTQVLIRPSTKNKEVQVLERCDEKPTTDKCTGDNIVQMTNKTVNTRMENDVTCTQTYTGLKNLEAQTRPDNTTGSCQTRIGNSQRQDCSQRQGCGLCATNNGGGRDCACGCHTVGVNKKTGRSSNSSESQPTATAGYKQKLKVGNAIELQVGDGTFKYETVAASTQYSMQEEPTTDRKCENKFAENKYYCHLEGAGEKICARCFTSEPTKLAAVTDADYTTSNGTYVSSSVLDSEDTSNLTCVCCRKPETVGNVQIYCYGAGTYPLCYHCHQEDTMSAGAGYYNPEHVCQCYGHINCDGTATAAVAERNEQNAERIDEEYCTCTKPFEHPQNGGYCGHCQNRLKKTAKGKGGIAYSLKLEDTSPRRFKKKKKKEQKLEEIRIRVPRSARATRKKIDKDKENHNKKVSECPECIRIMKNNCPKCIKISKLAEEKKGLTEARRYYKKGDFEVVTEISMEVSDDQSGKATASAKGACSLQEYLKINRPDFVDCAENRRKAVMISKLQREDDKDEMRLRFLSECPKKPDDDDKKEMKEITKRNYKKLPEVQEKLTNQRVQRLRNADKAMKEVLAKKIRTSVLKGKRTFPIDKNVVSLPNV